MNALCDLLRDILTVLRDVQARASRTETRLVRLAEALHVEVKE